MDHGMRSLRLLESHRLWCQRLLRHHGGSSRVAQSSRVMGLDLGLIWQRHWLPRHVRYRSLSRVGVVLRG